MKNKSIVTPPRPIDREKKNITISSEKQFSKNQLNIGTLERICAMCFYKMYNARAL